MSYTSPHTSVVEGVSLNQSLLQDFCAFVRGPRVVFVHVRGELPMLPRSPDVPKVCAKHLTGGDQSSWVDCAVPRVWTRIFDLALLNMASANAFLIVGALHPAYRNGMGKKGFILTEDISKNVVLDVEGWLDSPQPIIDDLRARASGSIMIDASASQPVSAQVAQLLLAARQTAVANNGTFEIVQPSEAVQSSLELLGLSELLRGTTP